MAYSRRGSSRYTARRAAPRRRTYARSSAYRGRVQRGRSKSRSSGREVRIVIQQAPAAAVTGPAIDPTSGQLVMPAGKPRTAKF